MSRPVVLSGEHPIVWSSVYADVSVRNSNDCDLTIFTLFKIFTTEKLLIILCISNVDIITMLATMWLQPYKSYCSNPYSLSDENI